MQRISAICTAAALACTLTVPVLAQTQTTTTTATAAEHSTRVSKLLGMSVYNEQNQNVGTIVDIMVQDTTGEATAILSVGDFVGGGPKLVAVPLRHVTVDPGKARMGGATKQALAAMPAYRSEGLLGGGG